jgi:3-dehydroquinate dehydratase-2
MKILIVNGPNLNLLGKREPEIYGNLTFDGYLVELRKKFPEVQIELKQSNIEGELIDILQDAEKNFQGIIFNPGGFAHTSVALLDTLKSIKKPVIEVHISNVYAREPFRHVMITASAANGIITGFGIAGYEIALRYLYDFKHP